MIWEAIVGLINLVIDGIVAAVSALLPSPPSFLTDLGGHVGSVMGYVGQFNVWLPVSEAAVVVPIVLGVYVAGLALGLIRWLLSYFLGGGGTT